MDHTEEKSQAGNVKQFPQANGKQAGNGKPAVDHKAAIAKMHPEHLHKLVQDAHAGKFGPAAQQTAQQAMQPAAPGAPGAQEGQPQDQQAPARNYSSIFSGQEPDGDEQEAPPTPQSRAAMFAGSRGGM